MEDQPYESMDARQAADALDVHLASRGHAMQHLREELSGAGLDPEEMLDGSLYSVSPLWAWISDRAGKLGTDPRSLTEDPARPSWPAWARHAPLVDPHPPAETIVLVDGFDAYLGELVHAEVPEAHWRPGQHRLADYPTVNYPVLAGAGHEVFLPAMPLYGAYQAAHGRKPISGTEMLAHTRRTISALRGEGPDAAAVEEPPVTVVAEIDCFDLGLREDIPAAHPQLVEEMIAELCDRDGVESVHRYGPAALVVDAPGWDALRLQLWATMWLQRHLPR